MKKLIATLMLVVPLGGCSFQAGPIHLALGDSESSSCNGYTDVDAEGAGACEEGSNFARGSHIGDNFVTLVLGVFDFARSLVAAVGVGLASVAPDDSDRNS